MRPDNDNQKDAQSERSADDTAAKKPGLGKRCRSAFKKAAGQNWKGILRQTARDLKDPKELALLATSTVVPGGWIGYGSYRIAKFNLTKDAPAVTADNDNAGAPADTAAAPADNTGAAAKPPKKWRLKGKTPKP